MAKIALKISNIYENGIELVQRLKKIKSPGRKTLLDALKVNNWFGVYSELLFRIELYAETGVLNYTKQDLNGITSAINTGKTSVSVLAKACIDKYVPKEQQVIIPMQVMQPINEVQQAKQNVIQKQIIPADNNWIDIDESEDSDDKVIVDDKTFYNNNKIKTITLPVWIKLISEFSEYAQEQGFELSDLSEFGDTDGLSNFDSLEPTDFIIEICKTTSDIKIEKVLEYMSEYFDQYSKEVEEVDLNN